MLGWDSHGDQPPMFCSRMGNGACVVPPVVTTPTSPSPAALPLTHAATLRYFEDRIGRLQGMEYYAERRLKRLGLLDDNGNTTWDDFFVDVRPPSFGRCWGFCGRQGSPFTQRRAASGWRGGRQHLPVPSFRPRGLHDATALLP